MFNGHRVSVGENEKFRRWMVVMLNTVATYFMPWICKLKNGLNGKILWVFDHFFFERKNHKDRFSLENSERGTCQDGV